MTKAPISLFGTSALLLCLYAGGLLRHQSDLDSFEIRIGRLAIGLKFAKPGLIAFPPP